MARFYRARIATDRGPILEAAGQYARRVVDADAYQTTQSCNRFFNTRYMRHETARHSGGMAIELHPDGFILGGACHKRLNDRAAREIGAKMAWNDARRQGCVRGGNGWLRLIKRLGPRELGTYGGGNREIGYNRARHEVFEQLVRTRKPFHEKTMNQWLRGISRMEFGGITVGLVEPRGGDEMLYRKGHAKSYTREATKQLVRSTK